jgi:uncharacterized protein YfbU (UPF0304 family)
MKLTDGEKLILLMLSEIYEKLGVYGETDPKFVRSTILNDMLWGLTWKYSGIPFEKTENPAAVSDVVSILDMWRLIEQSYAKLPPADKKRIETDAVPFGKNVSFLGFDGNNESEYMAIARFLVEDIGTFEYFKGRDFNSHVPSSLASYKRMYAVFEPMRRTLDNRDLSASQIIEVLNAKLHPEHRGSGTSAGG